MRRTTLFLALFLFSPALDGVAQEAAHVYEAYYKVKTGDLPEWNSYYFQYAVPVLEELRSEGVIEGWTQYQHMTGGEYNIRFAIRAFDWAAYDTFWAEYLGRTAATAGELLARLSGNDSAHENDPGPLRRGLGHRLRRRPGDRFIILPVRIYLPVQLRRYG